MIVALVPFDFPSVPINDDHGESTKKMNTIAYIAVDDAMPTEYGIWLMIGKFVNHIQGIWKICKLSKRLNF
jgi:hypothetical protein